MNSRTRMARFQKPPVGYCKGSKISPGTCFATAVRKTDEFEGSQKRCVTTTTDICKSQEGLARGAIVDAAMKPVVIVLLDPTRDAAARLVQRAVFGRPDFLLLQAAMEPLDIPVALRVMVGRAPVRDAQPPQRFDEPRRSELRPVGGGQRQLRLAAARGRPLQNCLLDRGQGFGGAAAVRQVLAHDLSRTAVDHAHQVGPSPGPGRPRF